MGFGSINSHNYFIAIIFFLVQQHTVTNGLQCYSCWKFRCEEPIDSCKEMRLFPSVNDQARRASENWRDSPECPLDSTDLNHQSNKYIRNCSSEEESCGSYFIRVTAAIARNSINETIYPILVTPNYYYSTIVALGCMKVEDTNKEENVTVTLKTATNAPINASTSGITTTTIPATTAAPTLLLNTTSASTNTTNNNNNNNNATIDNIDTTLTAKNSSSEIDSNISNNNGTKISPDDNKKENSTANSNSTAPTDAQSIGPSSAATKDKVDVLSVAPPLSLPLTSNHDDGHNHGPHHHHRDDDSDHHSDNAKSPHTPLLISPARHHAAVEKCNMSFSHVENRTTYGTLERINMTAVYTVCNVCNSSLCNSVYPQDDSNHASSPSLSTSSSSPTLSTPPTPISTSSSASTLSSFFILIIMTIII